MSSNSKSQSAVLYIAIGVLALAVAAGGFFFVKSSTASTEPYGVPFALTDHNGEQITQQALVGQPTAMFFGFTHCPEICPATMYELHSWLNNLGEEAADVNAYFVTVDPERDPPSRLKTYIENSTDRVIGVSGDPAKVEAMVKGFNIYSKRVELEDGDYTMDHYAAIILLDKNGQFHSTIAYGEDGEVAMEKLRRLVREG